MRALSAPSTGSPSRAPRWSRILLASCQQRATTSFTRPMPIAVGAEHGNRPEVVKNVFRCGGGAADPALGEGHVLG